MDVLTDFVAILNDPALAFQILEDFYASSASARSTKVDYTIDYK